MINNKKFAVALSGGASLGFAHLGFLKCLEEYDLIPDIISGTSAGALIGGAYAMGMPIKEIEDRVINFNKSEIIDVKFVPFFNESLLSSKKVDKFLQSIYGNVKINECKIKFIPTAVNITKKQIKYFTAGYLWQTIRASIAVPSIFMPFKIGKFRYIDGGVMDNIPTSILYKFKPDIVIAVNVINYDKVVIEAKNILHSLMNAMTLSQKELVRIKTKANFILNLDLNKVNMMAFKKEDSIENIRLGYEQTKENIEKIKALFN